MDGETWSLGFDSPLPAGSIGVRWTVVAPDAHPISGAFSFIVRHSERPPPTSVAGPGGSSVGGAASSDASSQLEASSEAAGHPSGDPPPASREPSNTDATSQMDRSETTTLEEFLQPPTSNAQGGKWLGRATSLLGLAAALAAIGAVALLRWVVGADQRARYLVMRWLRLAGLAASIAAVGDVTARLELVSAVDLLTGNYGIAFGLRLAGGMLVVIGTLRVMSRIQTADREMMTPAGRPSGGLALDPTAVSAQPRSDYALTRSTVVGVFALACAHLFDGHSVSEGPRLLTAAVDVVYVLGAGVWGGGVALVAVIVWDRHRAGLRVGAAELGMAFSVVAMWAVVATGLGGAALAVVMLDAPSELWTTGWGRLLVGKIALVTGAAGIGSYNH